MATIVSKEYATTLLDTIATTYATDGLEVAFLTGAPTISGGTLDISSVELSGVTNNGYARIPLPVADLTAASGNNPVALSNDAVLVSQYNGGASAWQAINYVAVIDAAAGGDVLMVIGTAAPVTIAEGRRARIPVGALTLRIASA